jgi:hypothetical protein
MRPPGCKPVGTWATATPDMGVNMSNVTTVLGASGALVASRGGGGTSFGVMGRGKGGVLVVGAPAGKPAGGIVDGELAVGLDPAPVIEPCAHACSAQATSNTEVPTMIDTIPAMTNRRGSPTLPGWVPADRENPRSVTWWTPAQKPLSR